jgi:hypothetical protein
VLEEAGAPPRAERDAREHGRMCVERAAVHRPQAWQIHPVRAHQRREEAAAGALPMAQTSEITPKSFWAPLRISNALWISSKKSRCPRRP